MIDSVKAPQSPALGKHAFVQQAAQQRSNCHQPAGRYSAVPPEFVSFENF